MCEEKTKVYAETGEELGTLFPNAIVRVLSYQKNTAYTDWPIWNVWINIDSLTTHLPMVNKAKLKPQKEYMVDKLRGFWSDLFVCGKLLKFVIRFFEFCEQNKVIDLSYHPKSPIAKYFIKPEKTTDFRNFFLPRRQRLGLFINLPWYFKYSVNSKIKELLMNAREREITVDIIIIHSARNKKARWFRELLKLCAYHWLLREKFQLVSSNKANCGIVICGYITTRPSKQSRAIARRFHNVFQKNKSKLK